MKEAKLAWRQILVTTAVTVVVVLVVQWISQHVRSKLLIAEARPLVEQMRDSVESPNTEISGSFGRASSLLQQAIQVAPEGSGARREALRLLAKLNILIFDRASRNPKPPNEFFRDAIRQLGLPPTDDG